MNWDTALIGSITILRLVKIVSIIIGAMILSKVITLTIRRRMKDAMRKENLSYITKGIYYLIVMISVMMVLPLMGINATGLVVAGGFLGIIIGFASQSIVGNMISGIFLMVERPIKIGHQVKIEGHAGFVEDITIFSTILRTYDGLFVRIPNETVFTTSIFNLVGNVARRVDLTVGIRYEDDIPKAKGIIGDVLSGKPFALVNPPPMVFVSDLGDNAVIIAVRVWAPTSEWFELRTQLLESMKTALEAEGIEIAFPQRTLWFANGLPESKHAGMVEFDDD